MKPTVQSKPSVIPSPNALPHGLNSGHVLIPGDNVAAFRAMRQGLFHIHQPRTFLEARCVEAIAANGWRIARCLREQVYFKTHLGTAMAGHPDATGSLCSPDLHRLHHRAADCALEEKRLERSTCRAERNLAWLQKARMENPASPMAAGLKPYEVLMAEGEPVIEDESTLGAAAGGEGAGDEGPVTVSAERRTQTFARRGTGMASPPVSRLGNRRQRRAAQRRGRFS